MQYAPRGDVTALSCFSPERRAGVNDMTLIAKSPSERVSTLSINRHLCTASLLVASASSPSSHLLIHITCLTAPLFLLSIHLGDYFNTLVGKESRVHIFQVCHHPSPVSDHPAKTSQAFFPFSFCPGHNPISPATNLLLISVSRYIPHSLRSGVPKHGIHLKQQSWTRQLQASLQRFTSATRALHMSSSPKSLACS